MAQAHIMDVKIRNNTRDAISNVYFYHQYSDKQSDIGCIVQAPLNVGEEKHIGKATCMTGFGSLGRDTWWIQFERDGRQFVSETDFQCTIKEDDAKTHRPVLLEIKDDELRVHMPHDEDSPCKSEIRVRKTVTELNAD